MQLVIWHQIWEVEGKYNKEIYRKINIIVLLQFK